MSLTAAGVNFLSQAVLGQGTPFNASNARLGVGNGSGAFVASQTDLQGSSKYRKAMDDDYPQITPPSITFKSTFASNEANFPWNEWGIFNAATGGVMLNRVVESNGTKQDNQTWILEVTITFAIGN
jgi:hypothetical protein